MNPVSSPAARRSALVFGAALLARLAFLLADEPLLFSHQYHYFNGGLAIAQHRDPWAFVLRSDDWRTWGEVWTIAPLYYLFLAAIFELFGPRLLAVQVIQALLDAGVAVMVSALGRRAVGDSRGWWAGLAYALYWPSIEMTHNTMTENLHTPLLVAGLLALLRVADGVRGGSPLPVGRSLGAGLLIGLSALVRTVGLAFLPLALLWQLGLVGWRRAWRAGAALVVAVVVVVGPWVARNWWVVGDPSPIESVSIVNLLHDNTFVDEERLTRREHFINKEKTPAARRDLALWYVKQGVTESWRKYPQKVWEQVRHFVRPEGLWVLLGAEQPWPAWRHGVRLLLDDTIFAVALPLFAVFLAAARPSPIRSLFVLWTAYYLFMLWVAFHSEIRYRTALMPFLLAGAAGGAALLARLGERRVQAGAGLAAGVLLLLLGFGPLLLPAARAARAAWRLRPAPALVARGDLAAAEEAVRSASAADPRSARPWTSYGRWLAASGRFSEALRAHGEADRRVDHHWIPRLAFPRLLAEAGRPEEAAAALREAHELSRTSDSWLMLEVAWRELPPPRTRVIEVGGSDYGAVRGFLHALPGGYRWSRHRAWLRLQPDTVAPAYEVVLELASLPPAPVSEPSVRVRVGGGAAARFRLSREFTPYTLRTPAPPGGVVEVEIEAPTWSRAGQPAEQGVAVRRMTVTPVRE